MYTQTFETSKKRKISVSGVLRLLSVSTSGYYSWKNRTPSKQAERKKKITEEIVQIYNESKQIYGAPKITTILNARGYKIAEKTVGNYMREAGIKAIWVSSYIKTTIDPDFDSKLKNILARQFNPSRPNSVWVTDITYVYTIEGFAYLISIMDLFSRKIIGWHISNSLCTSGVIKAIQKAKISRKIDEPVIIHSDRGCQYISDAYIAETPSSSFIRSYSAKATPWDNACIESFHALIKREWLNRFVIKHINHAHKLVFEYIECFYNTTRIHSHCNMMSPHDFENNIAI
ncbi:IS3 family transposase [Clostridium sp. 'deep sea']|uniref:IS3 family transposase n=1 Tax=Clostridium sp. 'deep sea' TaxID=2779445 RepID=UPI0018965DEF|nr:IS3 family transposase [Clostridium sp. 'deep sea']QOR37037.1 IS3 family transposase [Clostridium sp. 'deep sea']